MTLDELKQQLASSLKESHTYSDMCKIVSCCSRNLQKKTIDEYTLQTFFAEYKNWQDQFKNNFLHIAAFHGYQDLVPIMLAASINQHAKNNKEQTPLVTARTKKHEEIIRLLAPAEHHFASAPAPSLMPAPTRTRQRRPTRPTKPTLQQTFATNLQFLQERQSESNFQKISITMIRLLKNGQSDEIIKAWSTIRQACNQAKGHRGYNLLSKLHYVCQYNKSHKDISFKDLIGIASFIIQLDKDTSPESSRFINMEGGVILLYLNNAFQDNCDACIDLLKASLTNGLSDQARYKIITSLRLSWDKTKSQNIIRLFQLLAGENYSFCMQNHAHIAEYLSCALKIECIDFVLKVAENVKPSRSTSNFYSPSITIDPSEFLWLLVSYGQLRPEYIDIVKKLLSQGANPNHIYQEGTCQFTALTQMISPVSFSYDGWKGGTCNWKDSKSESERYTPLEILLQIIQLLLKHDANMFIELKHHIEDGKRALYNPETETFSTEYISQQDLTLVPFVRALDVAPVEICRMLIQHAKETVGFYHFTDDKPLWQHINENQRSEISSLISVRRPGL
jgi:hypothetical protein